MYIYIYIYIYMDHRMVYLILENLSQRHIATHPQHIFLPHGEREHLLQIPINEM